MTACLFVLLFAALAQSLILHETTVTDGLALLAVAASAAIVNIEAFKIAGLLAVALPDKRAIQPGPEIRKTQGIEAVIST